MLALLASVLMQAPQESPGFWERERLLQPPEMQGVTFTLAYTVEVISNVHGGVKRDTGIDQLMDGVIDADLQKALGWAGGSARINPMWLAGDGVTGDVGDLTLVSNITGRGEIRLFEAWLQQSVGKLCSFRVGILAADQEFMLTTGGTLYFNSVFGGPVFLTPNVAWPMYPVGAPGARARIDLVDGLYVHGAVYDGHPGTEDFNQTGLRIRLSDAEGLFTIGEAGWTWGTGTIKAGGFHHTAGPGISGGYGLVEQQLMDGLDAFVRVGTSDKTRSLVYLGIDAGLNLTGPIPGRPEDVLGFGAITARLSRGHETVFELTYRIRIARWGSLQPDVQYVLHPGGSTATPNAVVVGFRIDLLF